MSKTISVLSWTVPLAVMVALGLLLSIVLARLDVGASERDQQQAEIVALQAGLDEANERLEAEGEQPVPVPSVEPGADPALPQIVPGPRGFTGVRGIQGREGPPGEQGPRGRPGKDGMDGRLGATGIDGQPGRNGADGTDGVDGEDGTDGANGTNGADGKPGANGTNGKDGTGFADVECHTTGDWIFTLTDGTAITVEGPCRVTQPTPTPTTTP